jgi:antirestriction protein ArdC
MNIEELDAVVRNSITMGMLQYKALHEPDSDRIKLSEAKRYVKALGYPATFVLECERKGVLHRHKSGKTRNCAVWYSKRELQKCVVESKILGLINN